MHNHIEEKKGVKWVMRKDNLHDILGEGDGSIGEIAFYYFD